VTNGHRDIRALVRAGAGELEADLVITNGRLVNVATAEIYRADVAVLGATIVAVGDVAPIPEMAPASSTPAVAI
jgi:adenine deaminase